MPVADAVSFRQGGDNIALAVECDGSRFDLRTGEVRGQPATQPVDSYPVKEEDGKVWVLWDR